MALRLGQFLSSFSGGGAAAFTRGGWEGPKPSLNASCFEVFHWNHWMWDGFPRTLTLMHVCVHELQLLHVDVRFKVVGLSLEPTLVNVECLQGCKTAQLPKGDTLHSVSSKHRWY